MTSVRQTILISSAILLLLTGPACGAAAPATRPAPESTPSPTAMSTSENTPLPSMTPTPVNTPLPTATPAYDEEQMPTLPTPAMEGVIDVGGKHMLSYQCYGEGTPTEIVEAAAEDKPTLTLSWNAVILGVYPTTRICIYDRVPVNTIQDGAENLHALLGKIPLPGPYILVAHSLGGWYARVFAHLYPNEVAGMIMVDTSLTYPDSPIALATAYPTYSPDEAAGISQNRLSESDIYTMMMPQFDGLDMKASNEQVRQAGSFGDIPIVVICHTPGPQEFPGLDPVSEEIITALILKVEANMATLSSRSVFMVAATHQHFISEYQPQIIIDAITWIMQEIRNK